MNRYETKIFNAGFIL